MSDSLIIRELKKKENKTEVEWTLLKYWYSVAQISEILVQESKWHIESEDAIKKIREILQDNL